jgi:CRP-like cAMP-binding protein
MAKIADSPAAPRDILANTPFFADILDKAQLDTLAAGLRISDYKKGARLIREDDLGASMFAVAGGEVAVTVPGAGRGRKVATLRAGDIFGEMSLLTGSRRAATVTAVTPVTVIEIPKSALAPLIAASPGLADRFAAMLVKRQGELDRIYRDESRRNTASVDLGDLAGLIRGFFGGTV